MKLLVRNCTTRVVLRSTKEQKWLHDTLSVPVPGARFSKAYRRGWWDGRKRFFDKIRSTFPTGLLGTVLAANDLLKKGHKIKIVDKRKWSVPPKFDFNPVGDDDVCMCGADEESHGLLSDPQHNFTPMGWHHRRKAESDWSKLWLRHLTERLGGKPSKEKCTYQVNGALSVLSNKLGGVPWSRGIIQMPTGSGKTMTAACLLWMLEVPRTLVLCDRLDLLHQTHEELSRVLGDQRVNLLRGGSTRGDVVVSTVQTLNSRIKKKDKTTLKWLKGVRVLIVDECHKLGEGIYNNVQKRVPAYIRLGLSATPLTRGDTGDVHLVGATGELVYQIKTEDLIKKGLLARPTVYLCRIDHPALVFEKIVGEMDEEKRRRKAAKRFRKAYMKGIVTNTHRNEQVVSLALAAMSRKRPTLILVKLLKHGKIIQSMFEEQLIDIPPYLHGSDKVDVRRDAVKRFKAGEIPILIASTIFDEAVDIPNIETMILAGGGNSPIKGVQRIGRGMRPKKGGNTLEVYDFVDRTHKLLLRNSLERARIYEAQGYEVKTLDSPRRVVV